MKKAWLALTSFLFTFSVTGQVTFENTYNIGISALSSFVSSQDDGYLMAMISLKPDSYYLTFFKTDLNGDSLWTKDYNIGTLYNDTFTGTTDEEGNIYILPQSELTDVMKFDNDANMIWGRKYSCLKRRLAVKENILWVTGDHYPGNYLFKIDAATGDSLWRSDLFNNNNYSSSVATSVAVLDNGDVIVTASTTTFDGLMMPSNFYRLPADSTDLLEFTLPTEELFVVSDTKNLGNEIISVANDFSYTSLHKYCYFLRYTAAGTVNNITKTSLGYPPPRLYKCVITNDNQVVASGRIINGYYNSNVMLHCFSMDGDSIWTHLYGNRQTNPWDLIIANDNGIVMTGGTEQPYFYYDAYLLKTDPQGILTELPKIKHDISIEVYPNPTSDHVTFLTSGLKTGTITILDSKGQVCTELTVRDEKTVWNCNRFPHGLYLYMVVNGTKVSTGKLVVE